MISLADNLLPFIPRFSALLRNKPFPMPSPGPSLPSGILVDEEISLVHVSKYFYLAKPREVLADRYQTLVKVV
ncbi:protein kinase domain protein [Penicillium lagena]|uniref:protein kinase domain protein n=1 Tax=Penicillium lagena TaxID=94218 RepID=UPI0025402F53|nr:protein kinase domain protein [Penicillium lagena]KAJ5601147.1 protein kinase domain protein [Penicillium lagena]